MSLLRNTDVKKHLAPAAHRITVVPSKPDGNPDAVTPETTGIPADSGLAPLSTDLANGSLKADVV